MSPEQIAAAREVCKKRTPGEWVEERGEMIAAGVGTKGDGRPKRQRNRDRKVISIEPDGACSDPDCCSQGQHLEMSAEDAAYIAATTHPETGYEAALVEIERLRAALERIYRGEMPVAGLRPGLYGHAAKIAEDALEQKEAPGDSGPVE